jgi:large repetitive protein
MTRRDKQRRFSQWLRDLFTVETGGFQHRRIVVEPLERREVFAADALTAMLSSANNSLADVTGLGNTELVGTSQPGQTAEGEAANDLVAFAKALSDSGTLFYGAAWCQFCNEQKALFEDGAKFLPFIEVTNPDRSPNQIAIDEGITQYPTWKFNDGSTLVGAQTLATLSTRSGVAIPQASKPSFDTIPAATVAIGSPLMVPVDAYDPNGNPLTITVTSSNPGLINATVLSGNKSLKLNTNFGDMVFQLFEDKAPRPTQRVISLAESGFYDGLTFHRVVNNFVIQGGDPNGNGTGGSSLGNFDDQYHLDLQHNRTGVLSFAKSTDDTNNSQFFITEGPQRSLDFNHSIFGQLVEGEKVREAISNTAVSGSTPTNPVRINTATIFTDTENGIIQLKPTGSGTGTATITVTVTDTEGNSTAQSFTVTVVQDTANGAPFLNDIPTVFTTVNTPTTITLSSQDKEGDTRVYAVQKIGSENYSVTVNSSTGLVTFTPPPGFSGQLQFKASVSQTAATTTGSTTDEQIVTVLVGPPVPTSIDLTAGSDSGTSSTDNITNATTLSFTVGGTIAGATVSLKAGGAVVGQATATSETTTVNVTNPAILGQGSILFVATQTVDGQESAESPGLAVTYDTTAPTALPSSVFPASVQVGTPLNLNLAHSEEGLGLIYGLSDAPTGMTINASTGVIDWAPTSSQIGAHTFTLTLTDAAGNVTNQIVTLNVATPARVGFTLQTVDMAGTPITTIATGQNFKVRVFVQDLRTGTDATGLFSAFTDLLYNSSVIEPVAVNPISHGTVYNNATSGDTATPGIVNELGGLVSNVFGVLDNTPQLLAEVTFLAKIAGNAGLQLDPADDPVNDILFFNEPSTLITPEQISFGASSFAVGVNFTLVPDTYNFDEDSGVHVLNVLSNDITSGGAILTITAVGSTSSGGTVTIAADGKSLNYTSAPNFNGAETFTYTARNQDNVTLTTTVTVQVTDVNDPPIAVNDSFNVFSNSTQNVLDVLANDSRGVDENSSETLTIISVGPGSQAGTITIGPSGLTLRYTPRLGFTGPTETFTYTISDGRGGTATATVSVNVTPENPPPTAVNDAFTVVEDAPVATFDVLANDSTSDPGETLSIASVGSSSAGSQVSVSADGQSIRYQPKANFAGTDIVTYVLRDSRGGTATGTVTFTVTPVNDPPDAVDDNVTVQTSTPTTTLNVLANDITVDAGEVLTITAVTQPPTGKGTIAISSDGKSLIYTSPSTSFEGTFSFTYTISDGTGLSDTATVNVTAQAYVARTIGGSISGGDNSTNLSIGGLTLNLTGTNYAGQAVTNTATVAPDGSYAYNNLAPGNYTIARGALPFMLDASTQIQVASTPESGNQLNNSIPVGSLLPQYFDIRDFLGSTPKSGLTVALNADGTQHWYAAQGDWASLKSLSIQTNTAGDSLVMNATNGDSQNLTGTLALNSARVVQVAEQSSMKLLRVLGTPTEAGLTSSTTPTTFTTTSSGLQYKILTPGTGAKPNANSTVTVKYTGTLDNGTVFDRTNGDATATFGLNQVIAGWTEGLQLIAPGGRIELKIPPSLGYGAAGSGSTIPPNANLNFTVDLVSFTNPTATASGEGEGEGIAAPPAFTPFHSLSQGPTSSNREDFLPSSIISQLLGSSQTTDSPLPAAAVDSLMSEMMAMQELNPSSELATTLADSGTENTGLSETLPTRL